MFSNCLSPGDKYILAHLSILSVVGPLLSASIVSVRFDLHCTGKYLIFFPICLPPTPLTHRLASPRVVSPPNSVRPSLAMTLRRQTLPLQKPWLRHAPSSSSNKLQRIQTKRKSPRMTEAPSCSIPVQNLTASLLLFFSRRRRSPPAPPSVVLRSLQNGDTGRVWLPFFSLFLSVTLFLPHLSAAFLFCSSHTLCFISSRILPHTNGRPPLGSPSHAIADADSRRTRTGGLTQKGARRDGRHG